MSCTFFERASKLIYLFKNVSYTVFACYIIVDQYVNPVKEKLLFCKTMYMLFNN